MLFCRFDYQPCLVLSHNNHEIYPSLCQYHEFQSNQKNPLFQLHLESLLPSAEIREIPFLTLFENFDEKTRKFKKINSIEAVLEENDFLESERYAWLLDPSINGGGVWLDTGVHMMHLLYMVGAKMTDVISAKSYKYQFPTGDKRNEFIKSETAADVFLDIDGNDGRVAPNAFAHIRLGKCMPKSQKYFKVSFEKGEVFLDFENNSISYTDRAGPKAKFKEEILPKVKPYYNMVSAFVNYMNNGKIPPTTMPKVKESTDAVFRVYSKMIEGDPRQYY